MRMEAGQHEEGKILHDNIMELLDHGLRDEQLEDDETEDGVERRIWGTLVRLETQNKYLNTTHSLVCFFDCRILDPLDQEARLFCTSCALGVNRPA
jgi:hypothetical protein